jgi:hypothetical protein
MPSPSLALLLVFLQLLGALLCICPLLFHHLLVLCCCCLLLLLLLLCCEGGRALEAVHPGLEAPLRGLGKGGLGKEFSRSCP